jgi:hypothetical protein
MVRSEALLKALRQYRSCPRAEQFRKWLPSLELDDAIDEHFNSRVVGRFTSPVRTSCGFPAFARRIELASIEGADSRSLHDLSWKDDPLTLPPAGVRRRRVLS